MFNSFLYVYQAGYSLIFPFFHHHIVENMAPWRHFWVCKKKKSPAEPFTTCVGAQSVSVRLAFQDSRSARLQDGSING